MRRALILAVVALVASLAVASTAGAVPAEPPINFTVTPATGLAPVGATHTVTATPDLAAYYLEYQALAFEFEVISGPNKGVSDSNGGCVPANCVGGLTEMSVSPVTWTYRGTGGPGTDVIEVCAIRVGSVMELEVTVLDGDNEEVCKTVTMSWFVEERHPVVGGFPAAILPALADQAKENRARAAAAAAPPAPAVSPPSTGTGISIAPPNTGDAGLKDRSSSSEAYAVLALGAALVLGGVGALKLRRG